MCTQPINKEVSQVVAGRVLLPAVSRYAAKHDHCIEYSTSKNMGSPKSSMSRRFLAVYDDRVAACHY